MARELVGFATIKDNSTKRRIVRNDHWHNYYSDGTVELDIRMGGSSYTLGYGNYAVVNGLEKSILEVIRCQSNDGTWSHATKRAGEILCGEYWDTYSWALSGTSAVEAAISMNDEYWKQLGKHRPKIISFTFAWHGTSYLTKDMGAPFLLENHTGRCINLPHPKGRADEIDVVNKILLHTDLSQVGCIVFDTATWINGLYPWSQKWWQDIRDICDSYGILMITDDVASGWGKLKAYHPFTTAGYGIQPDISAVGKSLTAGYAPLGAALCNKKVGDVIGKPGVWNYNHTWQPSMVGIYTMINTYNFIEENNLMQKAQLIEDRLRDLGEHLSRVGIVNEHRVNGLFLSLDARKETAPTGLSSRFLRNNIRICAPLIANDSYFNELESYIHQQLI